MSLPLEGRSVLITRSARQAEGFTRQLSDLGASPIVMPAIEILPPEEYSALDEALQNLSRFEWVILTSVNGVAAVRERMEALGIPCKELADRRLAAIGPATAAALVDYCREPDVVPDEYVSEEIERALDEVSGLRFLLARADIARRDIAEQLAKRGAIVEEVTAYRIVQSEANCDLPDEAPDYITLMSAATADNTAKRLNQCCRGEWMNISKIVCIGPVTAERVRSLGYSVAAVATEYTTEGVIKALIRLESDTKKENMNV